MDKYILELSTILDKLNYSETLAELEILIDYFDKKYNPIPITIKPEFIERKNKPLPNQQQRLLPYHNRTDNP